MEKIINLVTGGAGFIGTNLIKNLLDKGEYVISLDNLLTGSSHNNSNFINNSSYQFIYHDVIEPIEIFANKIWHLASPASPKEYQKDPLLTSKINFMGTLNMLELARKNDSKIIFTSTSEIYGRSSFSEQDEFNNGILDTSNERSCYFESKRIAESLIFDFVRIHKIDAKVARIFNTYGPYMSKNDGRVVSNFIFQGLSRENLTIAGDGFQTRTFCYVSDIIDGLCKLMNSQINGPINLGSLDEITIRELAELICIKLNINRNFSFYEISKSEPLKRKPSIFQAKKLLNWEPKVNLELGIDKTIDFFRENYFQ